MTKVVGPFGLQWHQVNEAAVAHLNKWSVYVSPHGDRPEEDDAVLDHAWSKVQQFYNKYFINDNAEYHPSNIYSGACSFLVPFDTEELATEFYNIFTDEVLDSSCIYAALYEPSGKCITENN